MLQANSAVTTSADIQIRTRCVKLVTYSVAYDQSAVGLLGSREQRYVDATVKRLGLFLKWGARRVFIYK